jgi:hypothetical protein
MREKEKNTQTLSFFSLFFKFLSLLYRRPELQYPVRNKRNGKMYLRVNDFGIKKRKYLYALVEFVKGCSLEDTAASVSEIIGEIVSKTMIKETFRVNLLNTLSKFKGDANRISLTKFCEDNNIYPEIFQNDNAKWNRQRMIIVIIYLREVFDLRHPLEIKK